MKTALVTGSSVRTGRAIGLHLAREGWQAGLPWGRAVQVPQGFDVSLSGRGNRRRLRDWAALGVRPASGAPMPPDDVLAAVILPGGAGGWQVQLDIVLLLGRMSRFVCRLRASDWRIPAAIPQASP